MKYLISTDKAYLDTINTRPFSNPNTTTNKLVEIAKHPTENKWVAIIPDSHINSVGKRLTPEEAAVIVPALVDSLPDEWYIVVGHDPEIGDNKSLVLVD